MRSIIRAVIAFAFVIGFMHIVQRWWVESMVEVVKRSAEATKDQFSSRPIETNFQGLTSQDLQSINGTYRSGQ